MCDSCRLEHNRRAAERRAALVAVGFCRVCGEPVGYHLGEAVTTCPRHQEYYRARAAAARAHPSR